MTNRKSLSIICTPQRTYFGHKGPINFLHPAKPRCAMNWCGYKSCFVLQTLMVNIITFQYAVLYSLELDFLDLHLAVLSLNYILTHYSVA